jgi:hypothetical protein
MTNKAKKSIPSQQKKTSTPSPSKKKEKYYDASNSSSSSNSYKRYYRDDKPSFPVLDNEIKIDWDLFYNLLEQQTPSRSIQQERFLEWLVQYLTKVPGVEVTRDNFGNIYAVKGEAEFYPCVIAHTDINQDYTTHLKIVRNEKWVYGMDMDTGLQCGVGFDKCCRVVQ